MSVPITFNGVEYEIPEFRDTNYANELTQFFIAIPNGSLQPTGGLFTLLSEVDFGASYGLKSLYVKSRATHPAAAGIFRLGTAESVSWRTALNDGDVALTTDSSNNLTFNATKVLLSGAVVNADINASAAIAYSKLALTTSIVNGDINASAAIAHTKMAALTASRAMVSDGSGFVSASAATATEVGYLSGVTSAIQTQIDSKLFLAGGTMTGSLGIGSAAAASAILTLASTTKGLLTPRMTTTQRDAIVSPATGLFIYNTTTNLFNAYNGVAWVALTASGGGTVDAGSQYQLTYYAANGTTVSALPLISASSAVVSDANGLPIASAVTATELSYVSGVTSAIQSQMNLKAPLANPTFSGTITTALTASRALMTGSLSEIAVSAVSSTELGYLSGVSSAIQTQMDLKAPKANPTFTGVATFADGIVSAPGVTVGQSGVGLYRAGTNDLRITANGDYLKFAGTLITASVDFLPASNNTLDLGSASFNWRSIYVSTSIKNGSTTLATATELGYLSGVSSAIQTQITAKAPTASPTFTGTVTIPTPFTLGAVSVTATGTEMNYLVGVSSAIQTQLGLKAPLANPTFTGTVTVPNGAAATAATAFGQLKVIQVVSASTASVTSTTSGTYVNTALAATITPTSSSNKILILISGGIETSAAANNAQISVKRGSTEVTGGGLLIGHRPPASAVSRVGASCMYMDSPATTSSTTYTVVLLSSDGASTSRFPTNLGETTSIILMEVVA